MEDYRAQYSFLVDIASLYDIIDFVQMYGSASTQRGTIHQSGLSSDRPLLERLRQLHVALCRSLPTVHRSGDSTFHLQRGENRSPTAGK